MDENRLNTDINIEPEFWDDFIQEAFEHLDEIESNVITLEQSPDDMEIIHTMFRAYHTIKGLAGFVEHSIIQEVAHKTETMMDLCRKQELAVTHEVVDAILKSSDYIRRLCTEIDSFKDAGFVSDIEKHLVVLEGIVETAGGKPEVVCAEFQTPEVAPEVVSEPQQQEPEVNQPVEQEVHTEEADTSDVNGGWATSEVVEPVQVEQAYEVPEQPEAVPAPELTIPLGDMELNREDDSQDQSIEQNESVDVVQEPVFDVQPESEPVQEPVAETAAVEETSQASVEVDAETRAYKEQIMKKLAGNQQVQESASAKKQPANEEHMKVANSKIDHLVDMIGELIISQALLEQRIAAEYSTDNQLVSELSSFIGITRELQYLSMSLRMVSLKPTFHKLARIARDTIQELHKDVEFVTSGDATEIDRVVTDKLLDPLVHLLKNAISHGVEENPDDRTNAGKPRRARVELNAYNRRGKIYIEVKDDGRGINTEIVYNKALEKGLIDPNHTYTDDEIKEFILLPGFSTAAKVDNISGRGVGMDVVKTQILRIGGKVEINSELGKGSIFTLEVPVNHAIMNGTVVKMAGQDFIIPTANVKEILQPAENQWVSTQQKTTMLRVREDIIPIVPVSLLIKDYQQNGNSKLVMLLESDQELRALPIDNVINRQEVVVKPVGLEFSNLKYISGMSILGNGRVSLILDIDYLFKKEVKE